MLAISLKFPAKRFHATPWGRQVNEGSVEWPPSPWRLLRALVATWHHKFPDVEEVQIRELIESLAPPPHFKLPVASQGHTRHYMPLSNDDRTKVFDTFILMDPEDAVVAVWPDLSLNAHQSKLLDRLLNAMTYFGRAESWVCGEVIEVDSVDTDVKPLQLGIEPADGCELVRTLVPALVQEYEAWFSKTLEDHRQLKLSEQQAAATAKGKPADKIKLSKKDEQLLDESLPATLFDALHADTAELRKAGWNLPPGARWINYARPEHAFAPQSGIRSRPRRTDGLPTTARFAVCGPVRPLLTDAIIIGEQVRRVVMGCSKKVRRNDNSAAVFSGKNQDGSQLAGGHQHAHYLCEAANGDGHITHVTIFAPMGFDDHDEQAFTRLAKSGIWGIGGYELQLVLLGVGNRDEFGGLSEKAGQSKLFATSNAWRSRTPFVLSRHLTKKGLPSSDIIANDSTLLAELLAIVRFELSQRDQFKQFAHDTIIEPMLERKQAGTILGGNFISWLKFRRERLNGGGSKGGSNGFGFRLKFPRPVTGPIALGYGCHFGLGLFVAE